MVDVPELNSLLALSTSAASLGLAVLVLRRTPNRPAGNTFVTAMVFFFLSTVFTYLIREAFQYQPFDPDRALMYKRIFYFFHMLAVGYTAAFVGSYFYGFQVFSRRFVNLGMQVGLLVVAVLISAQVTTLRSPSALWGLAIFATLYMLSALIAILRTLWKNKDPVVRKQASLFLLGIIVHGTGAESYAYFRLYTTAFPPPWLTATALIMVGCFAFAIARYQMFVVTPKREEPVPVPQKYTLRPGHAYLVAERTPELALRALADAVHHGRTGLVISRAPPDAIREDFDVAGVPVLWLTTSVGRNHVPPTHLDLLEDVVTKFAGQWGNSVVCFDGIEYLANYHDFGRVMRTLHAIRDAVTGKGGVLLVSTNTGSMEERETSILDRELEPLPVPSRIQSVEDVFLIHESGLLISHAARRLKPEADRDTMAGMLTAIMNFARLSFSEGQSDLRLLELGEKTVVLERGKNLILAVAILGKASPQIDAELRTFLYRAERRYGPLLERWNGSLEEVADLHAMTQKMVGRLLT